MENNLKEAIEKSGNNLHLRVVRAIEERTINRIDGVNWKVDLNYYYCDDTTAKPREIDIVAQTGDISVCDKFSMPAGSFRVFLFIECKHFLNEVAFRVQKNNERESEEAIKVNSINKQVYSNAEVRGRHHYFSTPFVGKLYDSPKEEDEKVFNAITQPIKALTFFKNYTHIRGIYYPVVVYDGIDGVYEIKDGDFNNLNSLQKNEMSLFGLNYSYKNQISQLPENSYFYVDFIKEAKLNEFIDLIIDEAVKIRDNM